jgi:hypothetical protein
METVTGLASTQTPDDRGVANPSWEGVSETSLCSSLSTAQHLLEWEKAYRPVGSALFFFNHHLVITSISFLLHFTSRTRQARSILSTPLHYFINYIKLFTSFF